MSPLLFVFKQICTDDLNLDTTLENYPELLESDWYLFWQEKGEDIVQTSWLELYSDYVIKEDIQEGTNINSPEENLNYLSNDEEIVSNDCKKNLQETLENQEVTNLSTPNEEGEESFTSPSWQELWDLHYLKTYENTYKLYQFVHYQQYCFHRPGLIDIPEEKSIEEVEYKVEFINQSEELKALDLPISFGGRGYKNRTIILSDQDSESLSEEDFEMSPIQEQTIKQAPKKKKSRKKRNIPKVILKDKSLSKYWNKRFSLFSRFDQGILLDAESWFSVTPEKVAIHMAQRLSCDTIIDGFCGSGGNAIQFALTCCKVIAVDIDPEKIKNARHNASIYGVENKIDFIVGDFLQLCSSLKGDVVFLSPPWGGPKYISANEYDIEESLEPLGATALAQKSRQISENIVFFLPKNSKSEQIKKLAGVGSRVEIEHNYLNTRLVGLTAIYGDWLIDKKNLCK